MNPQAAVGGITCRVRYIAVMDRWACITLRCCVAVECKHYDTWADAYAAAQLRVKHPRMVSR